MKRHLANCITAARIVLAGALAGLKPFSAAFYAVYLSTWITDILDGWVARKLKAESSLGAKLDTAADLVLAAVLFIKLYPLLHPSIAIVIWAAAIMLLKLASMTVIHERFGVFGMVHTRLNKLTGMLLMAYPLVMQWIDSNISLTVLAVIATIAAAEELIICIVHKDFLADRKGIWG